MNIFSYGVGCFPAINRRGRLGLACVGLVFLSLQLGCAGTPAGASNEELFEKIIIATDAGEEQTVIDGFFLDEKTAQIVVLTIDNNGDRELKMFRLRKKAWEPALVASVPRDVLFVDVLRSRNRDRLITIERGAVKWFDPGTGNFRSLATVYANYGSADDHEGSAKYAGGKIARTDITRDLNRDGHDDLIVPDFDGFWVAIQLQDGTFSRPYRYGPKEPFLDAPAMNEGKSYRDLGISASTIPIYLSRVHQFDENQDGRVDLVFWNEDHFDVYHQDASGNFETEAVVHTPGIPLDSDGIYTRAYDYVDDGVVSLLFGLNENSSRTVLHSFRDINDDGIADMVTLTLSGRTMLRQQSRYAVHLGAPTSQGITFARQASAIIAPNGSAGGMQPWGYSAQYFRDVDGDGQLDVFFKDVRVGPGGMARAMVGNSVPLDLEFHRQLNGAFPRSLVRRVKIRRFSPLSGLGNVYFPAVMLGDINGDGRADLLIGHGPKELRLWRGVPGADLFARKPENISAALPPDERHVWLSDLNGDGKSDVVIVNGPTGYRPDQSRTVTTLFSRQAVLTDAGESR